MKISLKHIKGEIIMDMVEVMEEFAKEHGIETDEVNKFLKRFKNPTTLEELMDFPHDMLKHTKYATFLDDTIKKFIDCEIAKNRYETITLKTVMKELNHRKSHLDEEDEDYEKDLKKIKKVEEALLATKFGSVVWNW